MLNVVLKGVKIVKSKNHINHNVLEIFAIVAVVMLIILLSIQETGTSRETPSLSSSSSIHLNSPADGTRVTSAKTTVNFNGTFSGNTNFANVTLHIWASRGSNKDLADESTISTKSFPFPTSGASDGTSLSLKSYLPLKYIFPYNGTYFWNIQTIDNYGFSNWGEENYTIYYEPTSVLVPNPTNQLVTSVALDDQSYVFFNETLISSECYASINASEGSCTTREGSATKDAGFQWNVILPAYDALNYISIRARGATITSTDRLSLSFYNFSSNKWTGLKQSSFSGPTVQMNIFYQTSDSNTIKDFVDEPGGRLMKIMFSTEGPIMDEMNMSYFEVVID